MTNLTPEYGVWEPAAEQALEDLRRGMPQRAVAEKYNVCRQTIYRWKKKLNPALDKRKAIC